MSVSLTVSKCKSNYNQEKHNHKKADIEKKYNAEQKNKVLTLNLMYARNGNEIISGFWRYIF